MRPLNPLRRRMAPASWLQVWTPAARRRVARSIQRNGGGKRFSMFCAPYRQTGAR